MFTLLPDTVADRVPVAMAAWMSETLISELLSVMLVLLVLSFCLAVFDTVTALLLLSVVLVLLFELSVEVSVLLLVTATDLLLLSVVLVMLMELSVSLLERVEAVI